MAFLQTEKLSYIYSRGTPFEKVAIRDINIGIERGESLFLLGHTGSGKSTFVQQLNALLQPSEGRVLLDGEDINRDKHARRDVKKRVGLVFQYPEYQLFEETVAQDIAFGPKNMGLKDEDIQERIREAAGFAGVDPAGSRRLMEQIRLYREETGATVLVVSHNMDDAARYAERIIVFDHGEVRMDGTPEEVFSDPESLSGCGLQLPQAASLAQTLRRDGLDLKGSIFTHEQLLRAVLEAGGKSPC